MTLCSHNHFEICHDQSACPVCRMMEEKDAVIKFLNRDGTPVHHSTMTPDQRAQKAIADPNDPMGAIERRLCQRVTTAIREAEAAKDETRELTIAQRDAATARAEKAESEHAKANRVCESYSEHIKTIEAEVQAQQSLRLDLLEACEQTEEERDLLLTVLNDVLDSARIDGAHAFAREALAKVNQKGVQECASHNPNDAFVMEPNPKTDARSTDASNPAATFQPETAGKPVCPQCTMLALHPPNRGQWQCSSCGHVWPVEPALKEDRDSLRTQLTQAQAECAAMRECIINPIIAKHLERSRRNEGQPGMPQGACSCVICRFPNSSGTDLLARLQAAEEDVRRLDWLEAHPHETAGCTWMNNLGRCWNFGQQGLTVGDCKRPMRAAIDATLSEVEV